MFGLRIPENLDDAGDDAGFIGATRTPTREHDGRLGRILSNGSHLLVYNVSNGTLRIATRTTPIAAEYTMKQPHDELKGRALLNDARHNKSTAFTNEERERFGLRGLLPAAVCGQDTQLRRMLENLRRKEHDIEKYIALRALEGRNERLFYRALMSHERTSFGSRVVYTSPQTTAGPCARCSTTGPIVTCG